jgi:hypothetical protein
MANHLGEVGDRPGSGNIGVGPHVCQAEKLSGLHSSRRLTAGPGRQQT